MLWLRMLGVALGLAWPDLFTPWRSSVVRWRLETYGVLDQQGHPLHAEAITFTRTAQFVIRERRALLRFLRWAACLDR